MNLKSYFQFFIITNAIIVFCDQNVPVLLLSNLDLKIQCPALSHENEKVLKNIMDPISNLYVMVEKNLSPEDLSNLVPKNIINKTKINYCPSVTKTIVPYISSRYEENYIFNLSSNNSAFLTKSIQESVKDIFPYVYFIYFQDEIKYNSRSDMIFAHYSFIEEIYEILNFSPKRFFILYTALEPSWVFKAKSGLRRKRDSEELNDQNILLLHEHVYMYLIQPLVLKIKPPISKQNNRIEIGKCSIVKSETENERINLNCEDRDIFLDYIKNDNSWALKSITIPNKDFIKTLKDQDLKFYFRDVRASIGFSYHCSEIILTESIPKSARHVSLTVRELQFECFDETNMATGQFSEAFDCAGWTTIPILMGLFVSAILLVILGIGIVMLLDIKANDRFDNPKQKTAMLLLIKN